MKKTKVERSIVEHTSPVWRLAGVVLASGAVVALGYYFRQVDLERAFATVAAVTLVGAVKHWARRRPDQMRLRLGPFDEVGEAAVRSADRIGAWALERSMTVGLIIYACYGVGLVVLQAVIVAALANLYAWPLAVAVGCAVAAYVAAPEFFASIARRVSISEAPEEGREVGSRDRKEAIERGERMTEPQNRVGARPSEARRDEDYRKNAEARFASPEGNTGIGYYDDDGEPLSAEEFSALVARDARLRDDEEDDG